MHWVLFLMLSSVAFSSPFKIAREIEQGIESDTADFPYLKKITDIAINKALAVAEHELIAKGYFAEAEKIHYEWNNIYHASFFTSQRDIGDHAPISVWLSDRYDLIEMLLGVEVCKALHISDLKTFNSGIPVTIRPCSFPMDAVPGERIDEYRRHFAEGEVYYGVVPAASYWAATIGCSIAVPIPMVCGLAGTLVEKLMGSFVAPRLSDSVYNRFCAKGTN